MDFEQIKQKIIKNIKNNCPEDFYFDNELITEYRDIFGDYFRIFATKNKNEIILTRQYLGSNFFIATLTKILT